MLGEFCLVSLPKLYSPYSPCIKPAPSSRTIISAFGVEGAVKCGNSLLYREIILVSVCG